MRPLIALVLAAACAGAQAQTEMVLDNVAPVFSTTGTWPASTSVSGYIGTNYQAKQQSAPPGAIVVDNTDAGFSVTGSWPSSTAVSGYLGTNYQHHYANGEPPSAVVSDNSSGSATGTWPTSTSVSGYVGTNYQVRAAGTGSNVFTWTLNAPAAGTYEVYARWTQHPNRATNAKYTVSHAGGGDVVTVNQEQGGGAWNLLGTYSFNAGASTVSLSDDANGYVIADAVMLVPPGAAPNTATWTLPVPSAGTYNVYARWTAHPNRATDAKYTIAHASGSSTVTANQEQNSGAWNLLGSYSFNAGNATVSLTDQANGYVIADAVMILPPNSPPNTATWTPNVAQAGQYEVYARWTQNANRATDAKYTVTHSGGSTTTAVNQQANGGAWNLLGTYSLAPGTSHKIALTDEANGYVVADAIRLVPVTVQAEPKLYFIHTDHLNSPRQIYDENQQLRWRWDQAEPFGANPPDENPAALGAFEFNLRFPGQYADKETGLHQNYFRDYSADLGRYVQPDPLGTVTTWPRTPTMGLNHSYLYAAGNALIYIDEWGLIWYCTLNFTVIPEPSTCTTAKCQPYVTGRGSHETRMGAEIAAALAAIRRLPAGCTLGEEIPQIPGVRHLPVSRCFPYKGPPIIDRRGPPNLETD
ncbi:MAG: RHS repeat-associated core domain-containing protein [Burkholderiales bacterium]